MRPITFTITFVSSLLLVYTAQSFAAMEACTLITQAQVGAALEVPVSAGTPIAKPSTCQWAGKGRIATLVMMEPRAGKSAVDSFNAGKTSTLPGITVEPISGIGDDSYYVYLSGTTRAGLGLVVKKGSSAFEIRVYGFDVNQAKPVAKALSQIIVGKL